MSSFFRALSKYYFQAKMSQPPRKNGPNAYDWRYDRLFGIHERRNGLRLV